MAKELRFHPAAFRFPAGVESQQQEVIKAAGLKW
jgi:hypothetical protein